MRTVDDLKEYLQNILDKLENNYEGYELLNWHANTYMLGSSFLAHGRDGYLVLEDAVEQPDED